MTDICRRSGKLDPVSHRRARTQRNVPLRQIVHLCGRDWDAGVACLAEVNSVRYSIARTVIAEIKLAASGVEALTLVGLCSWVT